MSGIERMLVSLAAFPNARFAIALFVIIGGYYLMYFDDGSSLDRQIKNIRRQVVTETQIAKKTERLIAERDMILKNRDALANQFNQSLQALPLEIDVAELHRGIHNTAKSSQIKVTSIRPNSIVENEFFDQLPIEIEAEGGFEKLVLFLSYLARLPRIVRIQSVSIKTNSRNELGGKRLVLSSELTGYRARPINLDELKNKSGGASHAPLINSTRGLLFGCWIG